jgi:hypothetical protein
VAKEIARKKTMEVIILFRGKSLPLIRSSVTINTPCVKKLPPVICGYNTFCCLKISFLLYELQILNCFFSNYKQVKNPVTFLISLLNLTS